jgi:hypothetical protein
METALPSNRGLVVCSAGFSRFENREAGGRSREVRKAFERAEARTTNPPKNPMIQNPMIKPTLLGIALLLAPPGLWAADPSGRARWNVVEAGAKGDGRTDCTGVFQELLDAAGRAGGGVVEVPAGRFRIDTRLRIPAYVTLEGIYRVPPTSSPTPTAPPAGSTLLAYAGRGSAEGEPFIRLAGNHATLAGLAIVYPEWKQTDVPPIPYPPCIASQDTENVGVQECLLLNPYEGIRFVRAHRHLIRNVTGYPIRRGIFVDECYDIGHIENIHFWPFGVTYVADNPYCKWINTQGTAIELARTDWQYVLNTFCFGYGIGYRFSKSKEGSANGNFVGLGADSCERAVVVEQAQPPGLLFVNGEFVGRWSSTNAICLDILPGAEGKVSLVNCAFWGPIDRCVRMRSPVGQFTASACNFVHWDTRSVGSPALELDAGRAIVQGCTFAQDNLHVAIASNVLSAIITANQAPGGLRVENQAGRRAQIALNEEDPIEWTTEARAHYSIDVGAPGDGRYLLQWHGAETAGRTYRWSTAGSRLLLPANPGQPARLTIEANVPPAAVNPDSGLYLDGRRLTALTNGTTVVALPATSANRRGVELRAATWIPRNTIPGSQDARQLGVQVYAIRLRADTAADRVFRANDGVWFPSGRAGE